MAAWRTVVRVDQVHSAEPVAVQAARERLQHVAHAGMVREELDLVRKRGSE